MGKIQRRKEKEKERQEKLQQKVDEVSSTPCVGKWADASDEEDEELDRLARPVSDSESESESDEDEKEEDKNKEDDKNKNEQRQGLGGDANTAKKKAAEDNPP